METPPNAVVDHRTIIVCSTSYSMLMNALCHVC